MLGLMRIDKCAYVMDRLPYQGAYRDPCLVTSCQERYRGVIDPLRGLYEWG